MPGQLLLAAVEVAALSALELVEPQRVVELQLLLLRQVLVNTALDELGVGILVEELVGFALVHWIFYLTIN